MIISKTTKEPIKYFRNSVEITVDEYNEIRSMIENRPTAPDGYAYRLTDALEWELYELPHEDPAEEVATEEDYLTALERLGVTND